MPSRTCSFIISLRSNLQKALHEFLLQRRRTTYGWKIYFAKISCQSNCSAAMSFKIPLALSVCHTFSLIIQLPNNPITHFAFGRSARDRTFDFINAVKRKGRAQDRRGLCASKGRLTLRRKEGREQSARTDGEREGRAEGQTAFSDDCGSSPDRRTTKGRRNHPRISVLGGELDSISRRRISSGSGAGAGRASHE